MTALHPRPCGGNAVKGLARFGNHLRHAVNGKYVDADPSRMEGGYSPVTAGILPRRALIRTCHEPLNTPSRGAPVPQSFIGAMTAHAMGVGLATAEIPRPLLAAYMTKQIFQLFPLQTEARSLEGTYLDHRLHERGSADTPFVYGNFISSLDGRIALIDDADGAGHVPDELVNPNDFRLFLELEAQADCLITHGGYLRSIAAGRLDDILQVGTTKETRDLAAWRRAHGLSAQPAVVIASASLDFPVPESVELHHQKVYIATGNEADPVRTRHLEQKGYEIIRAGEGRMVEGAPLVRALGRLGYKSLYLLTGPRMLQTMLHDRVLSRLYVTITHHIIGGEAFHTLTLGPELRQAGRLRLCSLYYDSGSESHAGQWFAQFEPEA